jgi:crotonobetainyl-CoA:carnitine CoA-transferase CaiB-like acyl-CoA transferase
MQHRGHWLEAEHAIYQTTFIESGRVKISSVVPRRPKAAIHFGRDNERVLKEILGYGDERIAALAQSGALA